MEYPRVIEVLRTLYRKSTEMVGGRLKGGYVNHEIQENKAINIAIQVLKKQIPKKPIKHQKLPNREFSYLCQICNRLYWEWSFMDNYCSSCGQKFNLEQEE